MREAIEADLLREVEEGECQWTAMQEIISERRPNGAKVEDSGLKNRYDTISENFTGCPVAP